MSVYLKELVLATNRTREYGLEAPNFQPYLTKRWLDENIIQEIAKLLQSKFPGTTVEDLSTKCLSLNKRMAPAVSELLGCRVLYTLGWIDEVVEGGYYSGFDDKFIADTLLYGHHGSKLNAHAWLTLPSMEIIDLTILTTIGHLKNQPALCGHLIMRHVDELTGISYKPVLVGDDFFAKAGIKVE